MIAAVMVLMDVDEVTSGIIFTVAFGIAVDDTIHFLSKLRLQLSQAEPCPSRSNAASSPLAKPLS